MKTKIAFVVFIIAGIIAAGLILANRDLKVDAIASGPESVAQPAPVAVPAPAPMPEIAGNPPLTVPAQPAAPARPKVAANVPAPTDTTQAGPPLIINGYQVQDPVARLALSFVGTDPESEAYWGEAINDPTMPAEERKDLIEDLNEDGLSNPEHPTAQDMPIIANRLRLIEAMAPSAMDQVNADAFAEAYKDLLNLYNGVPPN